MEKVSTSPTNKKMIEYRSFNCHCRHIAMPSSKQDSPSESPGADSANIKQLDFEKAYAELELIVGRMEHGEQDLEKSLSDFERGVALMKHCHSKLSDAEQKVDILVKDNNGLFQTEPFESKS